MGDAALGTANGASATRLDCQRVAEAIQRGAAWLARQQAADGSIERDLGIGAYYKAPWALAVAGRSTEAVRLLSWVRREAFSEDGDFGGVRNPTLGAAYPYPNGWIAAAAHKLGHFDLGGRGTRFILSYQDRATGGFFSDRERRGKQEIWVTCMCGLAALWGGYLTEAGRVAGYLRTMLDAQPDVERRFFTAYLPGSGLITDYPADQAIAYVVDVARQEDQWDFMPGIAMAFLGRFYLATGDAEALRTAEEYAAFGRRLNPDRYARHRLTKGGWGGAVMYLATGDGQYLRAARSVAEHYVSTQHSDGYWYDPQNRYRQVSGSTEVLCVLDEMLQALATAVG
jgi:hypothetical protein